MSNGKTVKARDLRDPKALPRELRQLAKMVEQQSAEAADIMEHAADELEALQIASSH